MITKTNNDEPTARRLLVAMRLLDQRRTRMETEQGDTRKKFAERLKEATQSLNEEIQAEPPLDDADCREQLQEIKTRFKSREAIKDAKKLELDKIKAAIAEIKSAIAECMRVEPEQISFEFLDQAGLGVSEAASRQVFSAVEDAIGMGAPPEGPLLELREMLVAFGGELYAEANASKPEPAVAGEGPEADDDDDDDEQDDDGNVALFQ